MLGFPLAVRELFRIPIRRISGGDHQMHLPPLTADGESVGLGLRGLGS